MDVFVPITENQWRGWVMAFGRVEAGGAELCKTGKAGAATG
jgi:hypothetical protein